MGKKVRISVPMANVELTKDMTERLSQPSETTGVTFEFNDVDTVTATISRSRAEAYFKAKRGRGRTSDTSDGRRYNDGDCLKKPGGGVLFVEKRSRKDQRHFRRTPLKMGKKVRISVPMANVELTKDMTERLSQPSETTGMAQALKEHLFVQVTFEFNDVDTVTATISRSRAEAYFKAKRGRGRTSDTSDDEAEPPQNQETYTIVIRLVDTPDNRAREAAQAAVQAAATAAAQAAASEAANAAGNAVKEAAHDLAESVVGALVAPEQRDAAKQQAKSTVEQHADNAAKNATDTAGNAASQAATQAATAAANKAAEGCFAYVKRKLLIIGARCLLALLRKLTV
ncbi:hypothetical protein HPB52_010159 [Rhipicephalus sanguineus]|uniref:Uncharacterized protein n=1 Tax=Rhipicephalus sanguineus TaxID=34632 RepID=A0A9D4PVP6_RHISA|nr:hypothetical protein HPB52_010159 [Rhipicephalus sanguineus]